MPGRRLSGLGLLVAVAASCAAPPPTITTPTITPGPPRIELPNPGIPYSPAEMFAVLERMPRSELSAELIRQEVAEALANAVWTFDGRPYRAIAADGFCGPRVCELSIQGVPSSLIEDRVDHYIFDVDPVSFEFSPAFVGLDGFPAELHERLDELVRAGLPPERLAGLFYDSANWLPPPQFGRFQVTYDEGGLEGSRGLRVLVDVRIGSVILVEEFTR